MIFAFVFIVWWGLGVTGFVYWWTKEYDLTLTECFGAFFCGVLGPIAWIVGKGIHGKSTGRPPWIVMRKRASLVDSE